MRLAAFILPCALALGCDSAGSAPEDPQVARGRALYMGSCIACHNMNPALPGGVGPELKGASRALLEAKLLKGEYPPGHAPKRDTKLMPLQPQLAASIDDLTAFLK